jgi:hypothetical protein
VARFFFNFFDGESLSEDETGVELPSIEFAYLEAGATALQMWPELLSEGIAPLDCAFDIVNDMGQLLMRFEFIDVINPVRIGASAPAAPLEVMCSDIAHTHRRAQQAKQDLDGSIRDVRQALDEVRSLLDKLAG